MRKLVHGWGINDADYLTTVREELERCDGKRVRKVLFDCIFFRTWAEMVRRCHSVREKERYPTYAECIVDERWRKFSAFRGWMIEQDWEGKQLDKDLLIKGNKVYSPDTCLFVDKYVNTFLTEKKSKVSDYPTGASYHKRSKLFQSVISIKGKTTTVGVYKTAEEAGKKYLQVKYQLALELAAQQTDARVAQALIARYYVEQSQSVI